MANERVIIELKGADEIANRLERMRMQDKIVKKQIDFLVRKVMQTALKKTRAETRQKMKSDPRKAYQAVKMVLYKKIIGGNLNIFAPRKAGKDKYADFRTKRKLREGQRGGNRRKRSAATIRRDTYMGKDRGFILQWMQRGTADRRIQTSKQGATGNRGKLTAKLQFPDITERHLQTALDELIDALVRTFDEIWAGKL